MTIIDVNFRKEHAKIEVMRQDSHKTGKSKSYPGFLINVRWS